MSVAHPQLPQGPQALAAQIRSLSDAIDALAMRVYDRLDTPAGDSKPIPFYVAQPVSFMFKDMTLRESAYVNQGEDFSILALTYAAFSSGPDTGAGAAPTLAANATDYTGPISVLNSGIVLSTGQGNGIGNTLPFEFDFAWNFRTKTGMPYFSAGNVVNGIPNAHLAPRTALGFSEQGDMLRFNRPQAVKAGESLMFTVKPTLWADATGRGGVAALGSLGTNTRVTVYMIGIGFRDGRMAWPTIRR